MPTIYDNYEDVMSQIIGTPVTSSYVFTYYTTYSYIDSKEFATEAYVANYVDEHGGGEMPDMSSYVSKDELSEQSYISYIIGRDIRPDTTGRWNSGSVDYEWDSTYQRNNYIGTKARIYGATSYEIWVGFGTGTYYYVNRTRIQPNGTTQADLGSSSNNWQNTYTKKLYLNNTDIETRLSSYVSKTDLNGMSYASQTYVADYVAEHGSSVDLSAYVSKTELSAQGYITSIPSEYVTQAELSANGYITSIPSEYVTQAELSANGYLTSHQSLVDYVTKTDLSNAGYITSIPSEYITQAELSANGYLTSHQSLADYPTYSYVSDNYLSLHGDRVMGGTLTLGNAVPAILGTERSWKIYEGGTGSGAYIALQGQVDSKNFFVRDNAGNNVLQILESSISGRSQIHHFSVNTYTNNIIPKGNNNKNLGSSSAQWAYTYTQNLILDGTNINDTIDSVKSIGKIHVGTATHNRTTYTTTCTVDDFETDSNGKPLAGTMIAVKLTSITGTNPSTLYQVHFVVNNKESDRLYGNTNSANNGFGNGRNWYRDMNDGLNRYWYWVFDGTYWVWHGISDERDTTYSAMSDAEASAGTSTSARLIKPVTLATYYTAKSCFSFDSSTNTLTITTT